MKTNRLLCLLIAVTALMGAARAEGPFRSHRWNSFYGLETNSRSLVFLGNSITNMHEWWEAFGGDNEILNRGTSGGFTYEVLDHLESIVAGQPAKIFVGIGTNDITQSEAPEVADNLRIIVTRIRRESPRTQVYVQSILPSTRGKRGERIVALNALLKPLIDSLNAQWGKVSYIDLFSQMVAPDGISLKKGYEGQSIAFDELHPNVLGFKLWCDYIAPQVGHPCLYSERTLQGGLGNNNALGDRLTCFEQLPVRASDILLLGDEMIHGGEWHELLGSPLVKSRGMGWGYPGVHLDNLKEMVPNVLHNGSEEPRAIVLYGGSYEAGRGMGLDTILAKYKEVVASIRARAPHTRLLFLSVLPVNDAARNQAYVEPLNRLLATYAREEGNALYVDAYTPVAAHRSLYMTGEYLYAPGYAKVAQKLAAALNSACATSFTAPTDRETEKRMAHIYARKELGDALTAALKVKEAAPSLQRAIDKSFALLSRGTATPRQYTTQATLLLAALPPTPNSLTSDSITASAVEAHETVTLFRTTAYTTPYRIPAIAKTVKGDLVAVVDYRHIRSDIGVIPNGRIDLRYRIRNHKSGRWGEVKSLVAAGDHQGEFVAFGDPCIVADRESGRVMVTSCCGNVSFPRGTRASHQGWARFYSQDGGATWSTYTDMAEPIFQMFDKRSAGPIRCFFIGSGKIFQSSTLKKGAYYRLYCAALVKLGDGTNSNFVFYSDDFGESWNILGGVETPAIPRGADEPKVEELPDGSILCSSRVSGGRLYNIYHFTHALTGEGAWDTMALSSRENGGVQGSSNPCNGEVECVPVTRKSDGKKMHLLLQSVPFGPLDRTNVGISYKGLASPEDYATPAALARNWEGHCLVSATSGAYSTLCMDSHNHVAFFYEENLVNDGFDMVYKDYSIETLTGGKYSLRAN